VRPAAVTARVAARAQPVPPSNQTSPLGGQPTAVEVGSGLVVVGAG
jgi:hypothetical protein